MIIVNQDRDRVLNLQHIAEIVLDEADICVSRKLGAGGGAIIGTYKTEERAKEVFQDIILTIEHYQNNYQHAKLSIYVMPEE